ANRVPLLYQQGACAITHAIETMKWKNYSLEQPAGALPVGPAMILIHVASTHIPFTSESKEAIADVPEFLNEIELALKDVARQLKSFLSRQDNLAKRREKEEIIQKVLPRIAKKTGEILGLDAPDISPVVAKIMGNVLVRRLVKNNNGKLNVELRVKNFGEAARSFSLHESLPVEIEDASPKPDKKLQLGRDTDYIWGISLKPGEQKAILYKAASGSSELPPTIVEGLEAEMVTGARASKVA
ncbi:MAG TPA: DNA topoisomerase VI subunit B, partial [Candidatus Methanoperedenaceae archaeon]|nr:DNA topoisomerase VI subunit B [Candidatus Methanoperedenaceae archaeon]